MAPELFESVRAAGTLPKPYSSPSSTTFCDPIVNKEILD